MNIEVNSQVKHERFGFGEVQLVRTTTALVRFEHGFEERPLSELQLILSPLESLKTGQIHELREVVLKCQALTIRSINDSWGVFSISRINLLPHQLWVCHKVLRKWPVHMLIADDVGLGKTIEAGLILWPLIAKKRVRRILIVTPSSLVNQWEERMRKMFDIRLTPYAQSLDTPKSDYWNTNHFVVASLPTLRQDHNGRHERMLMAENWDLLIVDEAHHLNSLENQGDTLGYRFINKMIEHGKFSSRLFFSATPHRGKDYGFYALLHSLKPEKFDPKLPIKKQKDLIADVVIRNNKQFVVDMEGKPLFKPVVSIPKTYQFSEPEQNFYEKLSWFITTGQTYASSLSSSGRNTVNLVLIAIQKLAASSVAAVSSAINGRIQRLEEARVSKDNCVAQMSEMASDLSHPELDDRYVELQASLAELTINVSLMENELPHLIELNQLASQIKDETKIKSLIEILETDFKDRTVVLFTEYKATQSLLYSVIEQRFGAGCVAFINGDERLDLIDANASRKITKSMSRYDAADAFNAGKVRFIISTEAGGEGIDLQDNCYSMIHVDLPWNPMRLHQRVGRLNRYGQKRIVEVITLRNPDTVESKIWNMLNLKIGKVMQSLSVAMDEPEDLLQIILGMTDSKFFEELFSQAMLRRNNEGEGLSEWFDAKTATFAGESAIETVKQLIGHANRFEYKNLIDVPRLDLENLQGFFESILRANKHKLMRDERGLLSLVTPNEWKKQFGIRKKYENLTFDRGTKNKEAEILGVGHKIFDLALEQAQSFEVSISVNKLLSSPLLIYMLKDQVTGDDGNQAFTMVGMLDDEKPTLLADVALFGLLSKMIEGSLSVSEELKQYSRPIIDFEERLPQIEEHLRLQAQGLKLPYQSISPTLIAAILPF